MSKLNKVYKIETVVKFFTYWAGALAFIILLGKISLFYYLTFLILFLFSIFLEYKNIYLNRTFINISAILFIILKLFTFNLEALITSFLEILLFLLSLKFLENKKFRDYMQIYLLSVIIFAGSTLIFLDIIFLVYLFLYLIILNASIVFLTYYSQDPEMFLSEQILLKIFFKTSIIPLLAIPFTALFFIILPRTDFPLFGFLNKSIKAKTGFSENVKLGDVSEIQEEDLVVFRAKMVKINDDLLYWRGIVLDSFDGKNWFSSHKRENKENLELKGTSIIQTIYLEPYGDKYLFGLDKPYKIKYNIPFQNIQKRALTFFLPFPITSRIKYEVFSFLTPFIYESKINKDLYLQLPKNLSENIKNLAKTLQGTTDEETAKNILRFLKYGKYTYSLSNLPLSSNPLEDFLFKYKYGNCEYFASSMAILLRINKIPSRLVAGYKGGIYNEVGKYYLIRQKDAHVWVEAFIENKGWVRYDPTPPLGFQTYKNLKLSKLELLFETINYYYINLILNYDLKKQLSVIKSISIPFKIFNLKIHLKIESFLYSLIFILSILMSIFLIIYFLKISKIKREEKLIKEFLKILENKGYKKDPAEGLEEFVLKIKEKNLKLKAFNFVKIFEEIYYKDKCFDKEINEKLKALIKEIQNLKDTLKGG